MNRKFRYLGQHDREKIERLRNRTTADAPETVRFVRESLRRLELKGVKCIINYPVYKGMLNINVEADNAKINAPDAACTVLLFHTEIERRRGTLYHGWRR